MGGLIHPHGFGKMLQAQNACVFSGYGFGAVQLESGGVGQDMVDQGSICRNPTPRSRKSATPTGMDTSMDFRLCSRAP